MARNNINDVARESPFKSARQTYVKRQTKNEDEKKKRIVYAKAIMEIDYVYKTYSQSHQVFIYNNKMYFFFLLFVFCV